MGESDIKVWIMIFSFWTMMTLLSMAFGEQLGTGRLHELKSDKESFEGMSGIDKFLTWTFDKLDEIPVVKVFIPLMRIMSFQVTGEIPKGLAVLMDLLLVVTIVMVIRLVRGNG